MINLNSPLVVSPDVMTRTVGEESVLLDLKTEQYMGLNSLGTRIWGLLAESPNPQAVFARLSEEFDVEPARLRKDLEGFLGELERLGLISQPTTA